MHVGQHWRLILHSPDERVALVDATFHNAEDAGADIRDLASETQR